MPEGPECRRYAKDLAERISGRQLLKVEILSGRYVKKKPSGVESFLAGMPEQIVGAGVHGKFIYWILKNDLFIWSTMGMTGQWSSLETSHSRVKFHLNDGAVYFNDQRNFGTLKFVRGKFRLIEKLNSFGPDLLAEDIPDDVFIDRIRTRPNWQITKALMDQSIVAGVGNYIKADSLWLSGISPKRNVSSLSDIELSALNRSIAHIMRESYNSGGATIKTYKNFDGSTGEYGRKFLVYNQKTDPDGNEVIKEMTDDKRSTWWCPLTQN
jgi:formamidopyrimidine-DNA glycosylase